MSIRNKDQKFRFSVSVFVVIVCCVSGNVVAQEHMTGTRPMGMGEAFIAGAAGADAIYHNPAGVGNAIMFAIEGSYTRDVLPEMDILNVSVLDSKTNQSVAAGIAFTWETADPEGQAEWEAYHVRVGLAVPVVERRLLLGLGGRYMKITSGSQELASDFTFDVGTVFHLSDMFSFGVVGYNLLSTGSSDKLAPIGLGIGASFNYGYAFLVSAEIRFDFTSKENASKENETTKKYNVGAEYLISNIVPIRAGYQYDELSENSYISAGLGFRDKVGAIDLCYRQNIDNSEEKLLSISLQLFL